MRPEPLTVDHAGADSWSRIRLRGVTLIEADIGPFFAIDKGVDNLRRVPLRTGSLLNFAATGVYGE